MDDLINKRDGQRAAEVERTSYLNWLDEWRDKPMVKVLVGMRRVGKSTLLAQWARRLRKRHRVKAANILFIERDSIGFSHLEDWRTLQDLVVAHFQGVVGPKALLIDEVQLIPKWEKVITALHKQGEMDIVVTGSNADLLSKELATLLAGRCVQIQVLPLSYREHLKLRGQEVSTEVEFERYLRYGGLPALHQMGNSPLLLEQALESIFSTVVFKDVVARHQLRNVPQFEKIAAFLFDNIGNLSTAKSIADFCKSQRISASVDAVLNYTRYLAECYAVFPVQRMDLKGKRLLEISQKVYAGDVGLRNALVRRSLEDIGALLENVVFLELLRRDYRVSVGKLGEREIDFCADRGSERHYFQVCYLLSDRATVEREFVPLESLGDNYPKFVLSMDRIDRSRNGIPQVYIPDWLCSGS